MPEFTLTYFPLYGRCSAILLQLAYAKADFEKKQITVEEWGNPATSKKPEYGGLPVLHIGGELFTESVPISRMIAIKHG